MRLRTAALTCVFARSLTCFGQWRCRNGRCLRGPFRGKHPLETRSVGLQVLQLLTLQLMCWVVGLGILTIQSGSRSGRCTFPHLNLCARRSTLGTITCKSCSRSRCCTFPHLSLCAGRSALGSLPANQARAQGVTTSHPSTHVLVGRPWEP